MCFYFSHLTCTFHFNCCLNKIFVIVIVIVITICISQCAWVSFYVSHDFLVINKLVVCSLSILPPKKKHPVQYGVAQ